MGTSSARIYLLTCFRSRRRNSNNMMNKIMTQKLSDGFTVCLYERAGMHVVRESQRYEKELRSGKELSTQFVEM